MSSPEGSLFLPPNQLELEDLTLAPYAMRTRLSRGRKYPESPHPYRSPYQRDRDRLVHCTAFRRLMHKTQVVVTETNDHHRTRLTHTLEVAQISRTIARQLGLNEDLTEAIALAHDLGHPPFGHAGETALDECMRDHGGFEHNLHGLRIVDVLEYRYADFPGLNLSYEVLQAQALHSKLREAPELHAYTQEGQPLLEAQVVDAADSLAYDTHDIDDALSVGLITAADMEEVAFWRRAIEQVKIHHPKLGPLQFQSTVIRALIDWQVNDLLDHTRQRLQAAEVRSIEEVRGAPQPLVGPGEEVLALKAELEEFLYRKVYRHTRVIRMSRKGSYFLQKMFQAFCMTPELLPERYYLRSKKDGVQRTVCDYLAGMTDRYAQDEYLRLFHPYTSV